MAKNNRGDTMTFRTNPRHRSWIIFLSLVDAFVVGIAVGIISSILYPHVRLCSDVPCDHFNARVWAIENIVSQKGTLPRYLAIGDSITEAAALPNICGRSAINAGIAGATIRTFDRLARYLADLAQPDFIVMALGTNDALQNRADVFQERLSTLVRSLNLWPVILVPLPPGQGVKNVNLFNAAIDSMQVIKVPALDNVETTDGVHLTALAYVAWKDSIASAASKAICP
jgi:lysophospholipase L1-like esterase